MPFKLKTYNNPSLDILTPIVNKFKLSNHQHSRCYEPEKSEVIEKQLLDNIIQRATENKTKLHILYDNRTDESIPCGLLALNFEVVGDFSTLSIDLIFICDSYRDKYIKELDSKISFYLLNIALQEAKKMNDTSHIDAVILTPINECVSKVYQDFGFEELSDDWLYLLVDNIN